MKTFHVLLLCGPDQVGRTAEGLNFLTMRGAQRVMTQGLLIADQFVLAVLFGATPEQLFRINRELHRELGHLNPSITAAQLDGRPQLVKTELYNATVYAFEQDGLVPTVTNVFRDIDVPIVSIAGAEYSAQEIGNPLAVIEVLIDLDGDAKAKCESALASICEEKAWDYTLTRADADSISFMGYGHFLRFPPSGNRFGGDRFRRID